MNITPINYQTAYISNNMNQQNSSVNFTSRNADIRFADRIAREVNVLFPTLSLSKTNRYKSRNRYKVPNFHQGKSKSWEKNRKFNDALVELFEFNMSKNIYTILNKYMKLIEKYKMANCFEQSLLALVIAKCSGLKNCSIRGLCGKEDGWLDHAVVYVADKKKPYIIDPWLGFADYLPNVFEKYRGEYREFFIRMFTGKQEMFFKQDCMGGLPFTDEILTPKSIEKFAKARPKLCIQQKTVRK